MKVVIALPFYGLLGILYAGLAVLLMPFFMFSFVDVLRSIGMHPLAALLLGSFGHLPQPRDQPRQPRGAHALPEAVRACGGLRGGVRHAGPRVPRIVFQEERSYIAVNVGGAVIPLAVATYLAAHVFSPALLVSIVAASVLIYMTSRVVPNVGVVTPALAPPIIAVLAALIAGGGPVTTYVTAVYGTILGADLFNMRKVVRHKPPFVSIGGAGVFDGIYLSGVLATLLSRLF
jgi:uncharacterized membrane protein